MADTPTTAPDYAKDRELIIEGLVELNAKYSEILTRLTVLDDLVRGKHQPRPNE